MKDQNAIACVAQTWRDTLGDREAIAFLDVYEGKNTAESVEAVSLAFYRLLDGIVGDCNDREIHIRIQDKWYAVGRHGDEFWWGEIISEPVD